jgi:hypothetical protein
MVGCLDKGAVQVVVTYCAIARSIFHCVTTAGLVLREITKTKVRYVVLTRDGRQSWGRGSLHADLVWYTLSVVPKGDARI